MVKLLHGDCLEKLKELPDNSVDSIVTDPPYGISFMGKGWDVDVPKVAVWKECFRVIKPGGHLLSFFGTRTYHHGAIRIENAGFEIRDQIQWLYGSGFPKSLNLKDEWQGWGTALKPANEPIVVARKPLEKGLTVAQNVLKWGTGALNIDGSRIDLNGDYKCKANGRPSQTGLDDKYNPENANQPDYKGRWPANVILDEEAAKALDEQSGISKSTAAIRRNKSGMGIHDSEKTTFGKGDVFGGFNDSGGASRFFYVAKASKSERNKGLEGMPLVESGIKNDSGRGFSESDPHKKVMNQNFHPTVKPTKLMSHLVNMVTPPGGTVLDHFMGSGSTGVAAKSLCFSFIGIERDEEYFKIAERRITAKLRKKE